MDNRIWIGIVAVVAIVLGGSAYAHGGFAADDASNMWDVAENGTYEQFLELQEQGYGPFWIDSEEDFEAWQEHHELMEQRMERFGGMHGYGTQGMMGRSGRGGCHGW